MGVWKRGGVYWAYFYIDGIRHQESTYATTKRQAEKVFQKLRQDAINRKLGIVQTDPDLTVGEVTARFIAERIATPYHLGRADIFLEYFADIPVIQLTRAETERYRKWRHAQKKLKESTINRDLSVLRRILNWAVDARLLSTNPLGRLHLAPERRVRRPVLSVQEEDKLLAAASKHLRPIILMALDSGTRRGEILSERAEHIDFERNVLSVTHSKTAGGEFREIPLTERLRTLLSPYRGHEGLLFTFRKKPIYSIKTAWKTALRKSGIRRLRFHDLRHTFNTRLMEAGVMREVRMSLMGHSGGRSVQSIYTHVELPIKRRAIRQLEAWVESQRQTKGGSHGCTEVR